MGVNLWWLKQRTKVHARRVNRKRVLILEGWTRTQIQALTNGGYQYWKEWFKKANGWLVKWSSTFDHHEIRKGGEIESLNPQEWRIIGGIGEAQWNCKSY